MLIAQLTDLHVRPHGVLASGVVETNAMLERAFEHVAALDPAPDAVILSGYLTDAGLDEEYEILADLIRRHLPMPRRFSQDPHNRCP